MQKTKPIAEEFVKRAVIQWLSANNWGKNLKFGGLKDKGVDIEVRHNRYGRKFLIEAKGDGNARNPNSQREVNFNYALGQIVTRMKTGGKATYKYGNKYGLAFPTTFRKLVLRRLPYSICHKLNLYLFFVNTKGEVEMLDWEKVKDHQLDN